MKRLLILFFLLLNANCFSQKIDNQKLLDSLIVNTWITESVKVGDKLLQLTENQKASRVIFHKNHKSENRFNDFVERGKWIIEEKSMILKVSNDLFPTEEPLIFNIVLLEKNKLVFSIQNHDSDKQTLFTCVPEK